VSDVSIVPRDYDDEVARARRSALLLGRGAYATVGIGIIICIFAVVSWIRGESGLSVAIEYFVALGLATIVSGVAFIATSWNLALSASRLELQVAIQRTSAAPDKTI
jgi:hypothetical protein